MMAMKPVTFTGDWDKISGKAIAGAFTGKLNINLRRATTLNAMLVKKAIRRKIQGRIPPANSALTQAIKGSSKPLVDKGQLFQSITHRVISPFTAEVGIAKGNAYANIGAAVHEGAVIPVTPQMRGLFAVLANASRGNSSGLTGRAAQLFARNKDWKGLKKSTTSIKIPSRPFVKLAMADIALRNKLYANWQQALGGAITGKPPKFKVS